MTAPDPAVFAAEALAREVLAEHQRPRSYMEPRCSCGQPDTTAHLIAAARMDVEVLARMVQAVLALADQWRGRGYNDLLRAQGAGRDIRRALADAMTETEE